MDAARIVELLTPFLGNPAPFVGESPSSRVGGRAEGSVDLTSSQIENIRGYVELLLRWNARVNLTAIREREEIVTRHFGESLFAARHLFQTQQAATDHLIDFGSGAGFPGLPIKIWSPELKCTLIESNQKRSTFLREVVRKLGLANVEVFARRAEDLKGQADVLTLRAVERFELALPIAASLVRTGGRLALLVGEGQIARARDLVPGIAWDDPLNIPLSSRRALLIGRVVQPKNRPSQESTK